MRRERFLGAAAIVLLALSVLALVTLPSGEDSVEDVVPSEARLLLQGSTGEVRVLLIDRRGTLRLLVAYREDGGWHAIDVRPAPPGTDTAFASTNGAGPIPAFSAVYGRGVPGDVTVRWADGKTTTARTTPEGAYLSVREGKIKAEDVQTTPATTTTTAPPAPPPG